MPSEQDCSSAVVALTCSLLASVVLNIALMCWACAGPRAPVEVEMERLGASLLQDDATTTVFNRGETGPGAGAGAGADAVEANVMLELRSHDAPQTDQEI